MRSMVYVISRHSTSGLSKKGQWRHRAGRVRTHKRCKAVSETHLTKKYANPRIATGGATGIVLAVIKLTNCAMISIDGTLKEHE